MRFGVCTGLENLSLIAMAGFDYIEPSIVGALKPEMSEAEVMPNLRSAFANRSLCAAANGFLPGDLKMVGENVDAERITRYVEIALSRAKALGVSSVIFGSGAARHIPDGFSRDRAQEQTVDFLQTCGGIAARHTITIAIEPLHRGECNWINSVEEAVDLARTVNHPQIRVLSDLYHITQERQSYEETRDARELLAHVHVAGQVNRRAPMTDDMDYLTRYFTVLKQMGYPGSISIEGSWENLAAHASESLGVLRRAWDAA